MCMCVQEGAEPELRVGGPSLTQRLDLVSEPTSLNSPTRHSFSLCGVGSRNETCTCTWLAQLQSCALCL